MGCVTPPPWGRRRRSDQVREEMERRTAEVDLLPELYKKLEYLGRCKSTPPDVNLVDELSIPKASKVTFLERY